MEEYEEPENEESGQDPLKVVDKGKSQSDPFYHVEPSFQNQLVVAILLYEVLDPMVWKTFV